MAEQEYAYLPTYFVETEAWRRLVDGEVDIVSGPKGSGKSALYLLLLTRADDLADRGVFVEPAENPQGAMAFKDVVVADPPATEREFEYVWKLYITAIIGDLIADWGLSSRAAKDFIAALEEAGLREPRKNLRRVLRSAVDYIRSTGAVQAVEGGASVVQGVTGKITFFEPTQQERAAGYISLDTLLADANAALREEGFEIWPALDRLDVAFADTADLERNALRALFRVYNDMTAYDRINLKIFIRDDIWARIAEGGFREASHITRKMTIDWDADSLLNLIIRRVVSNSSVCEHYEIEPSDVLTSRDEQDALFYRLFPGQVDNGPNKPRTFRWMMLRTQDGSRKTAPRELIHLAEAAREVQIKQIENGEPDPPGETLIAAAALKKGLPNVSRHRLEGTLYAEYPALKAYIEKLEGHKTAQSPATLASIWRIDESEAVEIAEQLIAIGLFEDQSGSAEAPYWVPFLYRDALSMVQGTEEEPA